MNEVETKVEAFVKKHKGFCTVAGTCLAACILYKTGKYVGYQEGVEAMNKIFSDECLTLVQPVSHGWNFYKYNA